VRIYRGIAGKYRNDPFVPSALRDIDFTFLETVTKKLVPNDLLAEYEQKCIATIPAAQYKKVAPRAVYAYFLTLVYLSRLLVNNNVIMSIIHPTSFFRRMSNEPSGVLMKKAWYYLSEIFSETKLSPKTPLAVYMPPVVGGLQLLGVIDDYSLFQHLNYTFRMFNDHNVFPTMVLDWTADIETARQFAKTGCICSIDYDKYSLLMNEIIDDPALGRGVLFQHRNENNELNYSLIWKKQPRVIMVWNDIKETFVVHTHPKPFPVDELPLNERRVFGATDYTKYGCRKNINMQAQKGFTLFWPWEYTIDKLRSNKLGLALDFRVE
jgi:hypothetical protein